MLDVPCGNHHTIILDWTTIYLYVNIIFSVYACKRSNISSFGEYLVFTNLFIQIKRKTNVENLRLQQCKYQAVNIILCYERCHCMAHIFMFSIWYLIVEMGINKIIIAETCLSFVVHHLSQEIWVYIQSLQDALILSSKSSLTVARDLHTLRHKIPMVIASLMLDTCTCVNKLALKQLLIYLVSGNLSKKKKKPCYLLLLDNLSK